MRPAERPKSLIVHWPRFGPYHLARLRAAQKVLNERGIEVLGLEIASRDDTYLWREEHAADVKRRVVFPGLPYEGVGRMRLWRGVTKTLTRLQPSLVACNGYSTFDAWTLLLWSRWHRRPAILMTESKCDDADRIPWKEFLKSKIVRQFSAALCGGKPHRQYLERLGMRQELVFEGYDAIDNDYFWSQADRVRKNPFAYRDVPGLDQRGPFFLASSRFISRKNIDGLLRAYGDYRRSSANSGNPREPWRLIILGDGIERGALEHLVRTESIGGVTFAGFCQVDALPAYYGLAAAFIHPARQEQWGLVVNEAMAAGLPVIVSDRCGCAPDLVRNGVNGFTFPPDARARLAGLMRQMSSGQINLPAMGTASREIIQHWGPSRFAQGLLAAVQAVWGEGAGAGVQITAGG